MYLQNGISEWVSNPTTDGQQFGARGGMMRRLGGDGVDPRSPRMIYIDRADSRPQYVGFRLLLQPRT
jgi:hypothetical protein